jgi:hypothetical protein
MVKLVNRAKMTTGTTGTGTITLGSSSDGYQSFASAGVSNGDTVRYCIEDGNGFELGSGVYTASGTTLSRTVSESSNSNNALNLSGNAVVFVTAIADDVGVKSYSTISAMTSASTATTGALAYVAANSSVYVKNDSGWYRLAVINSTPTISSPSNAGDNTLASDGTATTITISAADADEGTTLAYSFTVSTGSTSGIATVKNASNTTLTAGTQYSTNVFKVVPATSGSGGTFTLTFNVHDQINTAQITQNFSLAFGFGNVNQLTVESSEEKSYASITDLDTANRGRIDFYDSGTKAVIQHGASIHNCTLTTAYDISTASISRSPHDQIRTGNAYWDLVWGSNPTHAYVLVTSAGGRLMQAVNSAYVLESANDTAVSSLGSMGRHSGVVVKDDATQKYFYIQTGGVIKRYDWTTTFSSASNATGQSVTLTGYSGTPSGLRMNDAGTKFYLIDYDVGVIRQHDLSTAWDLTTCSASASYTFTIPSSLSISHCTGVGIRRDGARLYLADGNNVTSSGGALHSFSFS